MTPVQQTITAPPDGNCLAACVASLFDMALADVPNFQANTEAFIGPDGKWDAKKPTAWWHAMAAFAAERDMVVFQGVMPASEKWGITMDPSKSLLCIATIASPRGDWDHCVVADLGSGKVVWDPHPEAKPGGYLQDATLRDLIIFIKPQHVVA